MCPVLPGVVSETRMLTRLKQALSFACFFMILVLTSLGMPATRGSNPHADSLPALKMLAKADSFYLKAEYIAATDLTVSVLEYYESAKNIAGQVICLNRLGDIYRGAENYQLCFEHLEMALKLARTTNDSLGIATNENIMAAALFEQGPGLSDSARTYAEKSLKYARRQHQDRLVCYNLNILGMIESTQGHNNEALALLEEALPVMRRINPQDEALLLTNIARVLYRAGRFPAAERYGQMAFTIAKQKNIAWYTIMSAQFLANLYHTTNRDAIAYPIMNELVGQLVRLHNESNEIKIRARKAMKEAAEKEKENEALRISHEQMKQQAEQRRLLQILFGLLLLVSVIFIILLLCQKRRLASVNAKLEQSNTTLQTFISIIAHDLKNPMNTILGFTDILIHESGSINDEERIKAVNYTNRAAFAAYNLLEHLLEWARLQTGIIKPEPQLIKLHELILEVLSTVQPMAVLKEQQINVNIPSEATCFADRNMILTLFRNLLSNASKFTSRQGVIDVKAVQRGDNITVSIHDNGIGMAQVQLDRLFLIDQQIRTKGTDGESGTGLGLLLCKEYAEKNLGKIVAESKSGEGSTFHVTLPASK